MAHLYYPSSIPSFCEKIKELKTETEIDCFISMSDNWELSDIETLIENVDNTYLFNFENRGRDVLPFIHVVNKIKHLQYEWLCKIHSKRSLHLQNGEKWRDSLWNELLSKKMLCAINSAEERIGIIAPEQSYVELTNEAAANNLSRCNELLSSLKIKNKDINEFIAGTMFWVKTNALSQIINNETHLNLFEPELGAIDGTTAHAFERIFLKIVTEAGFENKKVFASDFFDPYK